MKRVYRLGGVEYGTKKAVTERCQAILRSSIADGRPIPDGDTGFLSDLLAMHPEYDLKRGAGVRRFYLGQSDFGTRCFWLERVDGSKTDWSFLACLRPPTREQQVLSGMRRAVAPQVLQFLCDVYEMGCDVRCAISGELVARADAHVDHKPPMTFKRLAGEFLTISGLKFDDVAVNATDDGSTLTCLADPGLAKDWAEYHYKRALLQITSARSNLSQGSGR